MSAMVKEKKATHTPGPWSIPDWRQLGKIDIVDRNGINVALAYLRSDNVRDKLGSTEEANARLIAAAPDLLMVAQDLLGTLKFHRAYFDGGDLPEETRENYRRKIAHAETVIAKAKP